VDVGNGDDTTAGVDDPAVLTLVGAVGLTEPHATRRTDATAMPNFIERIKTSGADPTRENSKSYASRCS
jgi:hypothetical protein